MNCFGSICRTLLDIVAVPIDEQWASRDIFMVYKSTDRAVFIAHDRLYDTEITATGFSVD